jgi:CSLREA domain-containing protein
MLRAVIPTVSNDSHPEVHALQEFSWREFEGQGRLSRRQRRARERQERKQDRRKAPLQHFATGAAVALGALMAPAAHAATITVNSLADTSNAADGQCTLREALANATSNGDTTAGDCAAGTIGDSIQFNPSLNGGTITLGGTELATTLVTGDLLTISGPGSSQLTIDANDASRALPIHNVNLYSPTAISGLTIINGSSGGDGGAIYSYGDLTLNDVTITGSRFRARRTRRSAQRPAPGRL